MGGKHSSPQSDDLYEVLGVSRDATGQDIRRAYRQRSLQHHPDRGGDEQDFHRLTGAYEILSNDNLRRQYDKNGVNSTTSSDSFWSHAVDKNALEEGDHVYYHFAGGMCQHHGIVSRVCKSEVWIIDFGREAAPQPPGVAAPNKIKRRMRGSKLVQEVPLDTFLEGGRTLRRARYGVPRYLAPLEFVAAYSDVADAPEVVVQRARRLLRLGQMEYDVLLQNCETIAFWCKTNKRYSGQASKFVSNLQLTVGVSFATSGGLLIAAAATTGLVITTTAEVEGAVVVTTALAACTWAAIGVAIAGGLTFAVLLVIIGWRTCRRCDLKKTLGPRMMDLIAKLDSRDRLSLNPNHRFERWSVCELAKTLDRIAPDEHASDVIFLDASAFFEKFKENNRGNDNDKLEFLMEALVRCKIFNAMLDLPFDTQRIKSELPDEEAAEVRTMARMFQEAEVALLVREEPAGQDFTLDCVELVDVARHRTSDLIIRVVVQVPVAGASNAKQARNVETTKSKSDMVKLDEVLRELHPGVSKLDGQKLKSANTKTAVQVFHKYLTAIFELSNANVPHESQKTSLSNYLKLHRRVVLRQQVRCFFEVPGTL